MGGGGGGGGNVACRLKKMAMSPVTIFLIPCRIHSPMLPVDSKKW